MTSCIVCLCEPHEANDTIQLRYMLPCKCKLLLCNSCVDNISSCVYHRDKQFKHYILPRIDTLLAQSSSHVQTSSYVSDIMVLQRCTRELALSWTVFNVLKDVAYGLGGWVYGLMMSGVAVVVMFAILDTTSVTVTGVKVVRSIVCVSFACLIVYLYWLSGETI
jgi:hypothetical protein